MAKTNINKMLSLELNPSTDEQHSQLWYEQQLAVTQEVAFSYPEAYALDFNLPIVSVKVKYFKRLLDNIINTELNEAFTKADTGTKNMAAYLAVNLHREVVSRLNKLKDSVSKGGYSIAELQDARDYSADKRRFEFIYLFNYLIQASIKQYLEFQERFKDKLPAGQIYGLPFFYNEVLACPVPSPAYVRPLVAPTAAPAAVESVPENQQEQKPSTESFTCVNIARNGECVKDLYNALLKIEKLIDPSTKYIDFKKVFTGASVTVPVKWIGTATELYYFIKYIYADKHYLADVNKQQWNIACKCFVDKDGNAFVPAKLKSLKTPAKKSKDAIEKCGNLLCA